MKLTAEEILKFKEEYKERMKQGTTTLFLTDYEAERKDAWAEKIFNNVDFSFMFDVLIPNVEYAKNYGYEVVG